MVTISENFLVSELTKRWEKEGKIVVKELIIPIIYNIFYDNFLEGRKSVRIDLAAFDRENDSITFVEAENGLWMQHPQIYLPFSNKLFLLCPRDHSSYREEQLEWSDRIGVGIIEYSIEEGLVETKNAKNKELSPKMSTYVKARILKRAKKEGYDIA